MLRDICSPELFMMGPVQPKNAKLCVVTGIASKSIGRLPGFALLFD